MNWAMGQGSVPYTNDRVSQLQNDIKLLDQRLSQFQTPFSKAGLSPGKDQSSNMGKLEDVVTKRIYSKSGQKLYVPLPDDHPKKTLYTKVLSPDRTGHRSSKKRLMDELSLSEYDVKGKGIRPYLTD